MVQSTFPLNVYLGIYIPIYIKGKNFAWRPLIAINACAAAMHGFLLAGDGGLLGGNFSEVQAAEHVHCE